MIGISTFHLSFMPLVFGQTQQQPFVPPSSGSGRPSNPDPLLRGLDLKPPVIPNQEPGIQTQPESGTGSGINLAEFGRRLSIPGSSASFVRQRDGSYRRVFGEINATDNTIYWMQGNTLYAEGPSGGNGTVSIDNGTGGVTTQTVTRGVYSLSGENGIGHRNEEILPWTRSLAGINATVANDGSTYYVGGVGLAHHLVLNEPGQPPGRIWRADGQLYANGSWTPCATAPSGTMFVGTASADGRWILPSDDSNPTPYLITRTRSGRIIRFRAGTTDLRVFEYNRNTNTWSPLTNRNDNTHSDAEVRAAILNLTNDTPPLQITTNLPSINTYSTALSQNISASGGTNINISSRYTFPQSTHRSDCTDTAQLVSYTQSGGTHYRLLIASTDNTGRTPLFAEYSFSQAELQRLATEHNIPTSPNWNNPNEVLQWLNRHFSFRPAENAGENYWRNKLNSTNDLLRRDLIPFGNIRNLQWRPVWNLGTTPIDPIQTAVQRLQGGTNSDDRFLIDDGPLGRRNAFDFVGCISFAHSFNLGSPITASRDVAIRDEIIRRTFGTDRSQVGVVSFTRDGTNYVIGVRGSTIEVYQWHHMSETYTMFSYYSYLPSEVNAEITRIFSANGINLTNLGFNPATQPANEQEYQSNLTYYTNLLRVTHLERIGLGSRLTWHTRRAGSNVDQILNTSNTIRRSP